MKAIADWTNRALAILTAIPLTLLCFDKNVLTDTPRGMFIAAALFAGPLVVLALSPNSWFSARLFFLSYAICLALSVRMLTYQSVFASPDPAFPNALTGNCFVSLSLFASTILVLAQRRREFQPLTGLGGLACGFAYPVGVFFVAAIFANL